jgi:hypothetical protein
VSQYPHTIPVPPGANGASQVLDTSLLACQALQPRQALGNLAATHLRALFVFSVGCLVSRQCHDIVLIAVSRFLRVGFQSSHTVAACFNSFNEAKSASGWCGHPSGLHDSLCTLRLCCSRSLQSPDQHDAVRQRRNTRYGWMASPYPTGTCTRQEAPSFAWRT